MGDRRPSNAEGDRTNEDMEDRGFEDFLLYAGDRADDSPMIAELPEDSCSLDLRLEPFQTEHQEPQDWSFQASTGPAYEQTFSDFIPDALDTLQSDGFVTPPDLQWDTSDYPPQEASSVDRTETQAPLNGISPWAFADFAASAPTAAAPTDTPRQHASPAIALEPVLDTSVQTVGYIQRKSGQGNFVLKCSEPACRTKRFSRLPEFDRHMETFHGVGEVLWCPEATCKRSKAYGKSPFAKVRKDKLREHVRKAHKFEYEG